MNDNGTNYIPLMRTADEVFVRVMSMLYTLREEGELSAGEPLTEILQALVMLDRRTLSEIDAKHGVKEVIRKGR